MWMVKSRASDKSPFCGIYSITLEASSVAASSIARSHYRVAYHDPL